MSTNCGLCASRQLEPAYQPERSRRGLRVHLCPSCGLVQSLPRKDRAPRQGAAVSSGADWGNVRYGKGFRTKALLDLVAAHCDLSQLGAVLDVGSNRGSFARALADAAPKARITAVEPDERVAASCRDVPRTTLLQSRIEDLQLESDHFELIFSCHTAEHLADPLAVLRDHYRCLRDGGILVLEVPNMAFLGREDVVEEWFIDKHLYHFSAMTLCRMVEQAGFTLIQKPDPADLDNLSLVARKDPQKTVPDVADLSDPREAAKAFGLMEAYCLNRVANLELLKDMALKITDHTTRRVAMWGAGRIFDSLVLHGGFDPGKLSLLIDTHLQALVPERHGCTVLGPEALSDESADLVIIMSRSFASEIAAEARIRAPNAEIVFYSDLLAKARPRQAA